LLDQLIPARDLVARELSRGRVTREERIIKLDGEFDHLHSELEQAVTRRRLCKQQLASTDALHQRHVISEIEYITQCRGLEVLDTEVVKLQGRLKNVEREKTEIRKSYPILEDLALTQVNALDQEIAQAQERLTAIRTEEQTVKVQLAADLSRAERQKQEQLQEIEYQIQQCDSQLSGLEHTLTIKVPFSGHLVYRNPSPSTALTDNPLLVLAPAKGLRLRVRLASFEASALEKAGPVILEMVWQDVERRFPGYLIRQCELKHDPGFVVGELACNPPAEAVRDLASNKTVKARLLWSPPLYILPLFDLGATLSAIGSVGWLGTLLRLLRKRSLPEAIKPSGRPLECAEVNEKPTGVPAGEANRRAISATCQDVAMGEFGSLGAVHRLLGSQLREAIIRRHLGPDLLAAIEWALDRHHERAAQSLSSGLGDEGLGDHLESLVNGPSPGPDQGDDVPEGPPSPEALERLIKILRVIAPECLLPQMNRLGPPTQVHFLTRRASATAETGDAGERLDRFSAETNGRDAFHPVKP